MSDPIFYRGEFVAMGTPCEIQLFAPTQTIAQAVAERVVADVRRLEARYSRYRDDSDLAAINRVAAAGGRIEVDEETASLLDYAQTCYRESEGLFDITSGLLRHAWPRNSTALPEAALIERLLERIGWDKLRWQSPCLAFPLAGMEIDFGGIVKEYAVDRAAALCAAAGIRHGFINLGGDLRVLGPRPGGMPWLIGVRHPRINNAILTTLSLTSGALAGSGDYERCVEIDGVRYGHILNPGTGHPVQALASVTVCAPLCVVAGSVATIAMLKEKQGGAWLAESGLPCLWVDLAGGCGGTLCDEMPQGAAGAPV